MCGLQMALRLLKASATRVIADTRCVAGGRLQGGGSNVRRTLTAVCFCTAVALGFASPVKAATLTITDTFGGSNTVWMLDVQTGCTSCSITLTANFQDPAGADTNAYTGSFVDSVQWLIGGADPTGITVNTAPGGTTNWGGELDASVSSNQCSGNANDATCVEWTGG